MVKKPGGPRFRGKKATRPYVKQPDPVLATLEDAVEEGALIARSTLVMEVKNHLIVLTLRDDQRLDRTEAGEFVTHEFEDFAEEQRGYARRMQHGAEIALKGEGSERDREAYKSLDASALTRRAEIYSALAAELERQSTDPKAIDEVVEAARLRAWDEVSAAIEDRLDDLRDFELHDFSAEVNYASEREERMAIFVALDLAPLEPPVRRRAR